MTILGKVLAFLNLLGLLGVLCLAAMVYGKQQAWKYANYRHDLLIDGIPLHDKELNKQGFPAAEELGEQTLKELFPQGQPVTTQVMEVDRVQGVLSAELQKVESDKARHLALLARYLQSLASGFSQRERLILIRINLADDDKAKALKTALQQGFRPALETMKDEGVKAIPVGVKPDRRKRPFEQVYLEAVHAQGGPPRNPFVEKLLETLPREGGKKYDAAFAGLADPLSEEAFLRAVRNEPGKSFQELFDAAYDEMLAAVDSDLYQTWEGHFKEAGKKPPPDADRQKSLPALEKPPSPPDQKKAVARLLFNLVEVLPTRGQQPAKTWDDPDYRRVINVVGLQVLNREIERQAGLYQKITNDLNAVIAQENSDFALVHQPLLEQIKDRAGQVDVQAAALQRTKDMVAAQEAIVKRRKEDVKVFIDDLDMVRKEKAAHLDALRKMSDELFQIRVQVRDATRLNQEYERQIGALEERVR